MTNKHKLGIQGASLQYVGYKKNNLKCWIAFMDFFKHYYKYLYCRADLRRSEIWPVPTQIDIEEDNINAIVGGVFQFKHSIDMPRFS